MGTAGSNPVCELDEISKVGGLYPANFRKVGTAYPEKVSKVGDFLNLKKIFAHLTCGIIPTIAHVRCAIVGQTFTESDMLKGTRVLMGDEARLYNKVINTLRGLVHRG